MIIIFPWFIPKKNTSTQDRASSVIILTESNIPQILFSTFLILVVPNHCSFEQKILFFTGSNNIRNLKVKP